jgi:hypothetical protein
MCDPTGMRTSTLKKRWHAFNGAKSNFWSKNDRALNFPVKPRSMARIDRKNLSQPWPLAASGTVMIIASILLWIGIVLGVIALF